MFQYTRDQALHLNSSEKYLEFYLYLHIKLDLQFLFLKFHFFYDVIFINFQFIIKDYFNQNHCFESLLT